MFDKIFAKRQSLKNQLPVDGDGVSQSGSSNSSSYRVAKPQNVSMGACPRDDSTSSFQEQPLTLSQILQKTRLEQQDRENQRKAELNRRNTEVITRFIVEHIEPLLRAQALAGLSKTLYLFIPPDTEQAKLQQIMPLDQNIVEGFGGSEKSGPYISGFRTKEYVKVMRLIKPEYSLEFWQQPAIMKELEEALKKRLQANGEKLADTTPNSAGRTWFVRSFVYGEMISPGYTGIELRLAHAKKDASDPSSIKMIHLYAEIA